MKMDSLNSCLENYRSAGRPHFVHFVLALEGKGLFFRQMTPPDENPAFKALFVCGPTASGKTSYALDLAEKIGGEIVNGDAFQLYREFFFLLFI